MGFIGLIFAFIFYYILCCFTNIYFDLFLAAGIAWFIFAHHYAKKLPQERKDSFQTLRTIVCGLFWLGLVVISVVATIFGNVHISLM